MRMGERIKDNFNRYSISGPTFVASGILFREQVFAQFLSSFSVQAKKKVVFTVTCQKKKKIGSVGRDFFFFLTQMYMFGFHYASKTRFYTHEIGCVFLFLVLFISKILGNVKTKSVGIILRIVNSSVRMQSIRRPCCSLR